MDTDDTVRVDPEKLMEVAQSIQKEALEFDSHLASAKQWLVVLEEMWKGDAASLYHARLTELLNDVAAKFEACATAPKELADYAVRYAQVDDSVTVEALQLLIDVQDIVEKADWASI